MDCEPGTGNSMPGTHDSAVQCMCVHVSLLNKFTLVIHRILGLFHVQNILYLNISYRSRCTKKLMRTFAVENFI